MGLPRADGQFGRGRLVAPHGRGGEVSRSFAVVRRLCQHPRLALRHDRTAAREPRDGAAVVRGFSPPDHPRHGRGAPPAGLGARHRPHRRPRGQFRGRLSGRGMGRRGTCAVRPPRADRHGGQSLAVDDRRGRNAAHGHRGRRHVRPAARRRRNEGTGRGPRHRIADLPRKQRLQPHAAGP